MSIDGDCDDPFYEHEWNNCSKVLGGKCNKCDLGFYKRSMKGNLYCSALCWLPKKEEIPNEISKRTS